MNSRKTTRRKFFAIFTVMIWITTAILAVVPMAHYIVCSMEIESLVELSRNSVYGLTVDKMANLLTLNETRKKIEIEFIFFSPFYGISIFLSYIWKNKENELIAILKSCII